MAAPTNAALVNKTLANSEPSTDIAGLAACDADREVQDAF
jgi:hypothetical protein